MKHSFLLLFVLVVLLCQSEAQANTIHPTRHSLTGIESVNGSSSDGGCTSRDGSICNLQDGGTSVLFDNTILPLSELNGNQWARDLFTLRRPIVSSTFISIGFDFGTAVPVRRIELVLFNCRERSIRAGDIQVYVEGSPTMFPRPDPTRLTNARGRLFITGFESCENLYRVCVSLAAATQVFYIVFPNAAGSDWVHLAEVTFYNDSSSCTGRDMLITDPVTPPPETTTEAGPPTTPKNYTEPITISQQSTIQPTNGKLEFSLGIILGVVIFIVAIFTSVTIIILVAILCWTKRHPQLNTANKIKSPVYEAVDEHSGVPLDYEVPVFNNTPNELDKAIHNDDTTDPDTEYDYVNSDLGPPTEAGTSGQMPTDSSARDFEMEANISYSYVQSSHTRTNGSS